MSKMKPDAKPALVWQAMQSKQPRPLPPGEKPKVDTPDMWTLYEVTPNTDKVIADRFYVHHRHLFCNGDGVPHVYMADAARWTQNDVEGSVKSFAKQYVYVLYKELAEVTAMRKEAQAAGGREGEVEQLGNRLSAITKLITYMEKASTIRNIGTLAWVHLKQVLKEAPSQPMDPNPELLACKNGVVDLRTGELCWPRPEDYITRNTAVDYVPDADCTEWKRIMLEIFGGDTEMAEYMQRVVGYMATGAVKEQCVFILQGLGDNGKNLIVDAVKAALGSYAATVDTVAFNDDAKDSAVDYQKARLAGVRFGYSSELKDQVRLNEAFVKSVTGDRTITARHIYGKPFEYQQVVKLAILTNPRPIVRGTDNGIWRRIRLIEFKVAFGTQAQVDAGLAQALKDDGLLTHFTTEAGREQVLCWIVEGAKSYFLNGLHTPAQVHNATAQYRREEDYLGEFLEEVLEPLTVEEIEVFKEDEKVSIKRVEPGKRLYVRKDLLYLAYREWCVETEHGAMNASRFKNRLAMRPGLPRLEAHDVWVTAGKEPVYRYARLNKRGNRLVEIALERNSRGLR